MEFELLGPLRDEEIIAKGSSIRELKRLQRTYGRGNWRKMKGVTQVRFSSGAQCVAEVHWYEAHGIGRKEFKVKHILEKLR